MKKTLLLSLLAVFNVVVQAQTTELLDINNVVAHVNANTMLFNDMDESMAGFEVPAGNETHIIYASRFWMGGITPDQQLKLSGGTFGPGNGESDFFPGPLRSDGTASTNQATMDAYNRVWKVNQVDVTTHLAYYDALQNGTAEIEFPNGYIMPEYFNEWPAHGDVNDGFAFYIAPFYDYNSDGMYDPSSGDAPMICGDQAIYYVFNDHGGIGNETMGLPLGLEVHVMVYGYSIGGTAMDNTVFVKYKCINRSTSTYEDTYVGIWTNFDIGSSIDDYVGTDVGRSSYYAFGGDDFDAPTSSSPGYGYLIPRASVQILAGPRMDPDGEDNDFPNPVVPFSYGSYGPFAYGFDDGMIDNERLGLTSSMYYNNSSNAINGKPSGPYSYYLYMKATWKNGQHLLNGGNGVSGAGVQSGVFADYMFPGTSNPNNLGINGGEPDLWSELTAANPPGDRRIIGGCGPFTFNPGDEQNIDIAYVYSEETGSGMSEEEWMQHELDEVKSFYINDILDCYAFDLGSGTEELFTDHSAFQVFPNPASGSCRIDSDQQLVNTRFEIHDLTGRTVLSGQFQSGSNVININSLTSGIYMLHCKAGTQRLVVE